MCNKEQGYYQSQIDPDVAAQLERADWEPEEALRFYADGKHFDVVEGKTRILDTGSIASNALKSASLKYLELKGDAELAELRAELEAARAEIERLENQVQARGAELWGRTQKTLQLEQQLAAEQAKNVGLRELVEHFALIDLGRSLLPDDFGLWVLRARKAIATPSDTSSLEAIVKKAGEVMRERCVEYMLLDRKALDSNKAVWAANPHLTPEEDYISEWEDEARAGEFKAEAIRVLPAVTLEDLK